MRVVIAGGSGKVARLLQARLAERGHVPVALVRKQEQVDELVAGGVEATLIDLESASVEELAGAVTGADAVVFAAGAGGGDVRRTYAIDRDAEIRFSQAAEQAGVRRYVLVSTIGAGAPEHLEEESDYLVAKGEADADLVRRDLDWTIIRPGYLSNDPAAGTITTADPNSWQGAGIPRGDVADVVATALETPATVGRIVVVFGGGTPVREALEALR